MLRHRRTACRWVAASVRFPPAARHSICPTGALLCHAAADGLRPSSSELHGQAPLTRACARVALPTLPTSASDCVKIACIGGGPAGLYFAISMKLRDPSHDIEIFERNAPGVTFG